MPLIRVLSRSWNAFWYPLYTSCMPWSIAFFIYNISLLTYQKEREREKQIL